MHGGYANFYSRPCGRGDEADVCGRNAVIISTHAPAGGATYKVSTRVLTVRCISTHAPAGGATWMIRSYKGGGLIFLLTPLREGRLYRWYRKNGCGEISTHAPAGGATRGEAGKKADWTISTHAPAGGATVMARWAAQPPKFLLTPLREGRRRGGTGMNGFLKISTHAPAGGATGAAPFLFSLLMQFLLTPLREGRRAAHPHRGPRRKISTHAPAGGATDDLQSRITTMNRISTHAPAGGATILHCRHARGGQNFYSRPCGRGDPQRARERAAEDYFYSRPCGRGDFADGYRIERVVLISTHAPAGGATPP